MTWLPSKDRAPQREGYRGVDAPEAQRASELRQRASGHLLKLMPCKPFLRGRCSRRVRQNTWVRM
jgi:hypothetical protein